MHTHSYSHSKIAYLSTNTNAVTDGNTDERKNMNSVFIRMYLNQNPRTPMHARTHRLTPMPIVDCMPEVSSLPRPFFLQRTGKNWYFQSALPLPCLCLPLVFVSAFVGMLVPLLISKSLPVFPSLLCLHL